MDFFKMGYEKKEGFKLTKYELREVHFLGLPLKNYHTMMAVKKKQTKPQL